MFEKFRHKKIRYFSDSEVLKKYTYENYSSFFKRHISINILRFEKNKRKRSKNMLFREQTHINNRFELFFQIRRFSHITNKIDRKRQCQWRTLYSNTQSIQRIKYQIMHVSNWATDVFKKNKFNNEDFDSFTQHIIVKNFNIHHSIWKDVQVKADLKTWKLLAIMNEFQLISNFNFEISIFVSCRKNEITINLCLTTKKLTNRIIICRIREKLNHDFDHLFIKTIFDVSINTIFSKEKFCWNRLNKIKFEDTLNQKLLNTSNEANMRFLNDYTMKVCKVITQIIEIFTLKTTISVKVTSKFDDECKNVRIRIN